MSRITPPQQAATDLSQLKDYDPYRVQIAKVDTERGSAEYGSELRLVLDLAFTDDPTFTIRDWISMRLGRQQNGQVSKLRMLLNAIAQQPEATEIAWFDDESLEWSYDGDSAFAKVEEGFEVIVRGKVTEKQTDQGPKRRYAINAYQPATDEKPKPKAAPRPAPKPAPTRTTALGRTVRQDDDEEAPF